MQFFTQYIVYSFYCLFKDLLMFKITKIFLFFHQIYKYKITFEDYFECSSNIRDHFAMFYSRKYSRRKVLRESSKKPMSILWEKSGTWRWLVRRTKESKPFFIGFATVCGVIPGIIGFCVMSATNTRSPELEAQLRKNARPESLVCSLPLRILILLKLDQFVIYVCCIFCCFSCTGNCLGLSIA